MQVTRGSQHTRSKNQWITGKKEAEENTGLRKHHKKKQDKSPVKDQRLGVEDGSRIFKNFSEKTYDI